MKSKTFLHCFFVGYVILSAMSLYGEDIPWVNRPRGAPPMTFEEVGRHLAATVGVFAPNATLFQKETACKETMLSYTSKSSHAKKSFSSVNPYSVPVGSLPVTIGLISDDASDLFVYSDNNGKRGALIGRVSKPDGALWAKNAFAMGNFKMFPGCKYHMELNYQNVLYLKNEIGADVDGVTVYPIYVPDILLVTDSRTKNDAVPYCAYDPVQGSSNSELCLRADTTADVAPVLIQYTKNPSVKGSSAWRVVEELNAGEKEYFSPHLFPVNGYTSFGLNLKNGKSVEGEKCFASKPGSWPMENLLCQKK